MNVELRPQVIALLPLVCWAVRMGRDAPASLFAQTENPPPAPLSALALVNRLPVAKALAQTAPPPPLCTNICITSHLKVRMTKKLYSHVALSILQFQLKFQKILQIQTSVGTCPKSHLSIEWTMVF